MESTDGGDFRVKGTLHPNKRKTPPNVWARSEVQTQKSTKLCKTQSQGKKRHIFKSECTIQITYTVYLQQQHKNAVKHNHIEQKKKSIMPGKTKKNPKQNGSWKASFSFYLHMCLATWSSTTYKNTIHIFFGWQTVVKPWGTTIHIFFFGS